MKPESRGSIPGPKDEETGVLDLIRRKPSLIIGGEIDGLSQFSERGS
jgi:hypothetical protein